MKLEKCRNYGLKTPEFYQEDDFRVVIWRANETQSDPEVIQSDPEVIQSDPDIIKLTELIKSNPSISRAELARELSISERQTRKIIDKLRADGTLLRKGGIYNGKWIILEHDEGRAKQP